MRLSEEVVREGPEDVLPAKEVELLERARKGLVICPWCERPLVGEFFCHELDGGDIEAGVRLSCRCGFEEY